MSPASLAVSTAVLALLALSWRPAARAQDLRDPDEILAKIDGIIKDDAERWCARKRVAYPPSAVVLRVFKVERELEIWAKNAGQKKLRLIRTLPICAMDFAPGPKATEGDGKTPEGFYHPDFSYRSSNWWMWIDLADVDAPGKVGKGSCFKMCIEYPNRLDRGRTKAAATASSTGCRAAPSRPTRRYTNSGTTLKFTASMMPRSVILSSGMGGRVKNDMAM